MRLTGVLSAIALLLAVGCATRPGTAPPATQWSSYQVRAASITSWDLSAKVALRWRGGAESASLAWSQREHRSELDLSGPFGAGAVRITQEGDSLRVERGGEINLYDSSTPETLAAATGWPIPVGALPFWLRGLPDPGQELDRLALEDGRPSEIRQGGWIVTYKDYTAVGEGALPSRLRLTRPADAISLRLVNGRWTTDSL